MSEDQVRQAIRKDFPGAAARVTVAIHPSEKTTVLSLSVTDLLPHTGNARISYILGYRSKKLAQVNIVWTSDGTNVGDETVVGIANSLRDYFATSNFKPESVVVNHQLPAGAILVFRGSDAQNRTVLLILSGVAASVRPEEKRRRRYRRCRSNCPKSRTLPTPIFSRSARASSDPAAWENLWRSQRRLIAVSPFGSL
jgi:hypothetical protein